MKNNLVAAICFLVATVLWGVMAWTNFSDGKLAIAVFYAFTALVSIVASVLTFVKYTKGK